MHVTIPVEKEGYACDNISINRGRGEEVKAMHHVTNNASRIRRLEGKAMHVTKSVMEHKGRHASKHKSCERFPRGACHLALPERKSMVLSVSHSLYAPAWR
jgi:hypothetical protein